jgi:hypothetical protein
MVRKLCTGTTLHLLRILIRGSQDSFMILQCPGINGIIRVNQAMAQSTDHMEEEVDVESH